MSATVIKALQDSVEEVLKTYTGMVPKAGKPFIRSEPEALGDISAVNGLAGSGFTGMLTVTFTKEAIFKVVSVLFGSTPEELNEEVRDAAGELANQICGAFRRRFEEQGISLQASVPVIVTGEKHSITPLCTSQRMAIPFEFDGAKLVIELCLDKKKQ
ncbi:MAG: chemotaxis protein CheX [Thermodesulfobacteria bacterium]|nr:chemotaxis protein CheX [Thermodesulfobacteriota bacterium]